MLRKRKNKKEIVDCIIGVRFYCKEPDNHKTIYTITKSSDPEKVTITWNNGKTNYFKVDAMLYLENKTWIIL